VSRFYFIFEDRGDRDVSRFYCILKLKTKNLNGECVSPPPTQVAQTKKK
jgi:hypothetical protein